MACIFHEAPQDGLDFLERQLLLLTVVVKLDRLAQLIPVLVNLI